MDHCDGEVGGTVGYCVGGGNKRHMQRTELVYCTAGWLRRLLAGRDDPKDPHFYEIFVDEARPVLQSMHLAGAPIRVVVTSATFDPNDVPAAMDLLPPRTISPHTLNVGRRRHKVTELYLDDIASSELKAALVEHGLNTNHYRQVVQQAKALLDNEKNEVPLPGSNK